MVDKPVCLKCGGPLVLVRYLSGRATVEVSSFEQVWQDYETFCDIDDYEPHCECDDCGQGYEVVALGDNTWQVVLPS